MSREPVLTQVESKKRVIGWGRVVLERLAKGAALVCLLMFAFVTCWAGYQHIKADDALHWPGYLEELGYVYKHGTDTIYEGGQYYTAYLGVMKARLRLLLRLRRVRTIHELLTIYNDFRIQFDDQMSWRTSLHFNDTDGAEIWDGFDKALDRIDVVADARQAAKKGRQNIFRELVYMLHYSDIVQADPYRSILKSPNSVVCSYGAPEHDVPDSFESDPKEDREFREKLKQKLAAYNVAMYTAPEFAYRFKCKLNKAAIAADTKLQVIVDAAGPLDQQDAAIRFKAESSTPQGAAYYGHLEALKAMSAEQVVAGSYYNDAACYAIRANKDDALALILDKAGHLLSIPGSRRHHLYLAAREGTSRAFLMLLEESLTQGMTQEEILYAFKDIRRHNRNDIISELRKLDRNDPKYETLFTAMGLE